MVDLNHVLSNYDFVKVEEIVNHENAEPLTFYDIEVEDDHTFHIQFNDQYILSHNCDGHHICGLLCNLFGALWPDLMRQNVLYRLKTPVIVAKTPKESFEFFNLDEYREWEKKGIKHTPKYFKGLGSWKTSDFERFLSEEKYVTQIVADSEGVDMLEMVFGNNRSDDKKWWLR